MQTREIARENWQGFFDQVSSALQGKLIEIEVDSLELGAQIELEKISLNSITYDKRDDAFFISTDQIEHVIQEPLEVFLTEGVGGIDSIQVRSGDGTQQIVKFTEPLALPSAR